MLYAIKRALLFGRGRRYYVDATLGLDANDGRSPSSAWQTEAAINGNTNLRYGDRIHFKRGETWTLAAGLAVPTHGLYFGAYGAGADPILDGDAAFNSFTTNSNDSITIENIRFTNGSEFGLVISNSYNVHIKDVQADDCPNDNVIFTTNSHGCTIENLTSFTPSGAAIGNSCLEIKDGCHDITVINPTLHTAAGTGLFITSHNPLQGDCFPYNITVEGGHIYDCVHGIFVNKPDADVNADRNINIDGVLIDGTCTFGIYLQSEGQPINGLIFDNMLVYLHNVAAQYGVYCTGEAEFRRSVLAGTYPAVRVDTGGDVRLINCTLYRDGVNPLHIRNNPISTYMRNCILYSVGATPIYVQSITGVEDIDYNLYFPTIGDPVTDTAYNWNGTAYDWADWKTNSGQDANSPIPADPTFVNIATPDFTLQAGSPAINAGVDVGLPYSGIAPDCGAFERE